eukprot:COSAG01_NODE_22012_length_876_cov_0.727156_1_plen_138_part_00
MVAHDTYSMRKLLPPYLPRGANSALTVCVWPSPTVLCAGTKMHTGKRELATMPQLVMRAFFLSDYDLTLRSACGELNLGASCEEASPGSDTRARSVAAVITAVNPPLHLTSTLFLLSATLHSTNLQSHASIDGSTRP